MSEDIPYESVHCPHCGTTFAERTEACPQCDFSLATLDAQMPPPPLQAGPVNDWAGVLTAEDTQRLIQKCQAIHQAVQADLGVVTATERCRVRVDYPGTCGAVPVRRSICGRVIPGSQCTRASPWCEAQSGYSETLERPFCLMSSG
jgi:hypothetical protein